MLIPTTSWSDAFVSEYPVIALILLVAQIKPEIILYLGVAPAVKVHIPVAQK